MSTETEKDRKWSSREVVWGVFWLGPVAYFALGLWIAAECTNMTGTAGRIVYYIFAFWHGALSECGVDVSKRWKTVYVLWTIIVPLGFFIQYWVQGRLWPPEDAKRLEHMRHQQQLGLSFWVAIAAIFAVVYLQ